jgi:hypothetical protein
LPDVLSQKNAVREQLCLSSRRFEIEEIFMTAGKMLRYSTAVFALLAGAACGAQAQQIAAASSTAVETVVVSGTAFNPDVAPAKSSLDVTQPQTIINKSYIQDSTAATGTYTTILAIAPSMTGTDLNGPGLSDGGVKNTLRGIQDGNFGINYDGIPFGDTNGPTHHSQSYFPSSAIGSILVDRGPGNAGNIGPSTYGGTISLFSEELTRSAYSPGSYRRYLEHQPVQRQCAVGRLSDRRRHQSRDGELPGHQYRRLSEPSVQRGAKLPDQDPE